jgi:hypothetical protein
MQQPQQPPLSESDFARFSSDEEDADLTGHGPNIDDSEIVVRTVSAVVSCAFPGSLFFSLSPSRS